MFCSSLSISGAGVPAENAAPQQAIPLVVPAGVPLRLYLTKRVHKREGAPVEAKLLEPVYTFDHQVIPAGTVVLGRVARVKSVSKTERLRAILGGDFTPLHIAPIEFATLMMADGRQISLKTEESLGFPSIFLPKRVTKQNGATPQNAGVVASTKEQVHDAIQAQIDRARSIPDVVRGPDKKEKGEDYLITKLPYHPQYVRKGTRFDAELTKPLSFGSEPLPTGLLAEAGTQPPPGSVAQARLITPLDSRSSKQGEAVEAVLAEPVYSADHKLILPEGTRVEGTVVAARRARWFHRGGQLRFTFKEIELPEEVVPLQESARLVSAAASRPARPELKFRTEANLQDAESTAKTPLKVDGEGGVQAKESKTRFLAAAAAVMVARRAGDNDPIRNSSHQVIGQSQNVGGRTIGGGFGFGLLGTGIAHRVRAGWALPSAITAWHGMVAIFHCDCARFGGPVRQRQHGRDPVRHTFR